MNDIYDIKGLESPVVIEMLPTVLFTLLIVGLYMFWNYMQHAEKKNEIQEEHYPTEIPFDLGKAIEELSQKEKVLSNIEFLQEVHNIFGKYKGVFSLSLAEILEKNILTETEKHFFSHIYFEEYREEMEINRKQILSDLKQIASCK